MLAINPAAAERLHGIVFEARRSILGEPKGDEKAPLDKKNTAYT